MTPKAPARTTPPTQVRRRKRGLVYLRVSTRDQVNTDYNPEGISIPAQRDATTRKADELDTDIVDEYIEPGKTATSMDQRPAFQEMLARIKNLRDIDYIIVYHFNTTGATRRWWMSNCSTASSGSWPLTAAEAPASGATTTT